MWRVFDWVQSAAACIFGSTVVIARALVEAGCIAAPLYLMDRGYAQCYEVLGAWGGEFQASRLPRQL